MSYSDTFLRDVLTRTKVVAIVGASANPVRASYFVTRYMGLKGMRAIGINPGLAGQELLGERVYASLSDIPPEIEVDMVDIFRRPEHVLPIVEEAIARLPKLKTVWMQIDIENPEARALAEAKGIDVIENRCPKIEYQRLFGELRMGGFATGRISSKLGNS